NRGLRRRRQAEDRRRVGGSGAGRFMSHTGGAEEEHEEAGGVASHFDKRCGPAAKPAIPESMFISCRVCKASGAGAHAISMTESAFAKPTQSRRRFSLSCCE